MKTLFIIIILVSHVFASKEQLLHYVTDEVTGSSYKYYSLMYDGFIKIKLISETGDADLYASQITTKPTYEPDHYCLQATTCGEDIILIPDSFKRPVSIGVYGHPSHEVSQYTLLVYETTDSEDISYEGNSVNHASGYHNENKKAVVTTSITWFLLESLFQLLFA